MQFLPGITCVKETGMGILCVLSVVILSQLTTYFLAALLLGQFGGLLVWQWVHPVAPNTCGKVGLVV